MILSVREADGEDLDYDGGSEGEISGSSSSSSSFLSVEESGGSGSVSGGDGGGRYLIMPGAAAAAAGSYNSRSSPNSGGRCPTSSPRGRGKRELILDHMRSELRALRTSSDERDLRIASLRTERSALSRMLYSDQSSLVHFREQYDREEREMNWMRRVALRLGDEIVQQRRRAERGRRDVGGLRLALNGWDDNDDERRRRRAANEQREVTSTSDEGSSASGSSGVRPKMTKKASASARGIWDSLRRQGHGSSSSDKSSSVSGRNLGGEEAKTPPASRLLRGGSTGRGDAAPPNAEGPLTHHERKLSSNNNGGGGGKRGSTQHCTRCSSSAGCAIWDLPLCLRSRSRKSASSAAAAVVEEFAPPPEMRIAPFQAGNPRQERHGGEADENSKAMAAAAVRRRHLERAVKEGRGDGCTKVLSTRNLRLALAAAAS